MKRETKHDRSHNKNLSTGYFRLMEERIRQLTAQGKNKAASNSRCALKHLRAYRKGQDILLADVTHLLVSEFQDYLIRKEMKLNTVSLYLRMLRAAYNYAVEEELISEDRHPFRKAFTGQEKTRKRALPPQVVGRILTVRLSDPQLEFARDLFLFSLYTQGMPFVDIAHLKNTQVRNGCIVYRRHKTHRTLQVRIDPHAQRIIDKYRTAGSASPYVFSILHPREDGSLGYDSALRVYNKRLHHLSKLIGLDEPLTSYVSRHTWASLARANGISDTIICEAMGHNNVATTSIYLASLDTDTIASANQRLIASLTQGLL